MTDPKQDMLELVLDYELRSSPWVCWIGWPWLQQIAGRYFAWKVQRKFDRWQNSLIISAKLKARRHA